MYVGKEIVQKISVDLYMHIIIIDLPVVAYTFQIPLTLAEILGAYSIGFRNSRTGSSRQLDVLVMEHSTNKVFDLKGSMRSRFMIRLKRAMGTYCWMITTFNVCAC